MIEAIEEAGGILSKSQNKKQGKAEQGKFDAAPRYSPTTNKLIYNKEAGLAPDDMANILYNKGLINDPSESVMFEEIKDVESSTVSINKQNFEKAKNLAEIENQKIEFAEEVFSKEDGDLELDASDLFIGSKIIVDGTPLEVVEVESEGDGIIDAVILKDGARFGRQKLESGESLYVEKLEDPEFTKEENKPLELEKQTDEQIRAEKEQKKQKEEITKRQEKPLKGDAGDLTADIFGEGDTPLFNERRGKEAENRLVEIKELLPKETPKGEIRKWALQFKGTYQNKQSGLPWKVNRDTVSHSINNQRANTAWKMSVFSAIKEIAEDAITFPSNKAGQSQKDGVKEVRFYYVSVTLGEEPAIVRFVNHFKDSREGEVVHSYDVKTRRGKKHIRHKRSG